MNNISSDAMKIAIEESKVNSINNYKKRWTIWSYNSKRR